MNDKLKSYLFCLSIALCIQFAPLLFFIDPLLFHVENHSLCQNQPQNCLTYSKNRNIQIQIEVVHQDHDDIHIYIGQDRSSSIVKLVRIKKGS